MKLATFTFKKASPKDTSRIGVVADEGLFDLSVHCSDLPTSMLEFLWAGDDALALAARSFKKGGVLVPLDQVKIEQPVTRPGKILAIALNYVEHIEESKTKAPPVQMWFNKQSTCTNGPFDPIHLPRVSDMLDYEGELGIIIGKRCRHVPKERAHEVIAGYTIINDVSVRDWQLQSPTFQIGKSFDTHDPFGPWLVTTDEIEDPHSLTIKTWVNDELRQHSDTGHMIHNCYEQIAHLTSAFTLEPGDVLATGTPSGVGMAMNPPQYLRAGDKVRIEIEKIGYIENSVVKEPQGTLIE